MGVYRLHDFCKYFTLAYVDESKKDSDAWYSFSTAVHEFNELQSKRVRSHVWKTADESISVSFNIFFKYHFIYSSNSLYFLLIFRYWVQVCRLSKTGCMLYLEIQRGKEGMKTLPHNAFVGAIAGCTLRLFERSINSSCLDGHVIKGDAWFGSVQTAMEIGARGGETLLQVKGSKSLYP
jgi:hypothetical protein